ncbi:MAG TPA: hypothetical protein VLG47_06690 [Candidatus Saccharimonadales bacterium]|nr:hypothetical protein [Candidatus Saccharimonadales bacterium]
MIYKHDKRIKFYRLRQIRWQRFLLLGSAGVLTAIISGLGIVRFSSINVSQFFGSRGKHATGIKASVIPTSLHKSGSNAPAPAGTPISRITAASAIMKLRKQNCNLFGPRHPGLAHTSVPELRKLAQYEQACGGAVADRTSVFISTPKTTEEAKSSGIWVASVLKAYADNGIKPLIFMEPTAINGGNIDLKTIASGAYDSALSDFYLSIQSAGISNTQMGMWVYLPEGNLPGWTTTNPTVYATIVTKLATFQKQTFPGSLSSIMLDSASYSPGATWGNGHYVSLLPYVKNIPDGLIDSVGLQGFPWSPPASQSSESQLNDPKTYMQVDLAMEAARSLNVKNIWLNTGTFHEMYASQAGQSIFETDLQRQHELDGVLQLADEVKTHGFSVSIHLFAQNKAALSEGTDWSYWNKRPGDSQSTYVFKTFAHDAATDGIPIWLYDTTGN